MLAFSSLGVGSPLLWSAFVGFVLLMLALDLGVFHRKAHAVSLKEAAVWSTVWVVLALLFSVYVWQEFGSQAGTEFLTGYLIEKSLSIDNVFVFAVIFSLLGIPTVYQHRVLFWGVLSALVLRAIMIFAGAALLARFHWLIYVFGGFLVLTGIKLFFTWWMKSAATTDTRLLRFVQRVIPSTARLDGQRFFTVENGKRVATPLFLALVLVEISDVVFAIDSIPAIFAITSDPFLVFTCNVFAILGLRSLFFLLASAIEKFSLLKVGLSAVLVFVGVKMTLVDVYEIPSGVSLAVIATLLGGAIGASLLLQPHSVGGAPRQTSRPRTAE